MLTIAAGVILAVALILIFWSVGITFLIITGIILYLGLDYIPTFWELPPEQMFLAIVGLTVAVPLIERALKAASSDYAGSS